MRSAFVFKEKTAGQRYRDRRPLRVVPGYCISERHGTFRIRRPIPSGTLRRHIDVFREAGLQDSIRPLQFLFVAHGAA